MVARGKLLLTCSTSARLPAGACLTHSFICSPSCSDGMSNIVVAVVIVVHFETRPGEHKTRRPTEDGGSAAYVDPRWRRGGRGNGCGGERAGARAGERTERTTIVACIFNDVASCGGRAGAMVVVVVRGWGWRCCERDVPSKAVGRYPTERLAGRAALCRRRRRLRRLNERRHAARSQWEYDIWLARTDRHTHTHPARPAYCTHVKR